MTLLKWSFLFTLLKGGAGVEFLTNESHHENSAMPGMINVQSLPGNLPI